MSLLRAGNQETFGQAKRRKRAFPEEELSQWGQKYTKVKEIEGLGKAIESGEERYQLALYNCTQRPSKAQWDRTRSGQVVKWTKHQTSGFLQEPDLEEQHGCCGGVVTVEWKITFFFKSWKNLNILRPHRENFAHVPSINNATQGWGSWFSISGLRWLNFFKQTNYISFICFYKRLHYV